MVWSAHNKDQICFHGAEMPNPQSVAWNTHTMHIRPNLLARALIFLFVLLFLIIFLIGRASSVAWHVVFVIFLYTFFSVKEISSYCSLTLLFQRSLTADFSAFQDFLAQPPPWGLVCHNGLSYSISRSTGPIFHIRVVDTRPSRFTE